MKSDHSIIGGPQLAEQQLSKLSEPTQAKIRSTQILTTLPQIVSELVQNSLDAKASHIDVGLDSENWMCWVRDNGLGIAKKDLEGFASEDSDMRYRRLFLLLSYAGTHEKQGTSKEYLSNSVNAASTYGFRGEALASAAQISCLEVASRSTLGQKTWSMIKKGDQVLYKGEAVRWRRESPGTVVCVRDVFFNLPVRRLSHPSAAKTWDLVRQEIEVYALVSPSVSFSLEDLHKNGGNGSSNRMIRIPKTSSTLATFRYLYGRALTEEVETIDTTSGNLKARGFISLHRVSSKIYQFLYINNHPIALCDLHRVVDSQFLSSTFGKHSLPDWGKGGNTRIDSSRSPHRSENKPVYVLNILMPPSEVDNGIDPTKCIVGLQNKTSVTSFLIHVTRGFLAKHGFMPWPLNKQKALNMIQTGDAPHKRRRVFMDDDADDATNGSPLTQIPNLQLLSLRSGSSQVLSDSCHEGELNGRVLARNRSYFNPAQHSGLPLASTPGMRCDDNHKQGSNQKCTISSLKLRSRSSATASIPTWLRSALEANNSYSLPEQQIPSALTLLVQDLHSAERNLTFVGHLHSCDSTYPSSISSLQNPTSGFFSRADLFSATIIGQVDQKFIACLISHANARNPVSQKPSHCPEKGTAAPDASTLVLVDQHAADERVRVEGFLKELCLGFLDNCHSSADNGSGVKLRIITPPKPVLVTRHELRLLQESTEIQQAFRNWGIRFTSLSPPGPSTVDSSTDSDNNGHGQILVETVPEIISDKLLQEGELQDLVKGFLTQLQTDLPSFSGLSDSNLNQGTDKKFLWLKALRYCPRALLDLINSKACRGAIMFNDSLTAVQCENLVWRLSLTAYPFQCAHGRPSLVPLIELAPKTGRLGPRQAFPCDWSKLEA